MKDSFPVSFFEHIRRNKAEIMLHVLGWSIYYLVDFIFVIGFTSDLTSSAVMTYFSTIFIYTFCFYFIVEIYKRFFPKQMIKGILISLITVVIFSILNSLWDIYIIRYDKSILKLESNPWHVYLFETWRFSTSALYAFAYWIYLQRIDDQRLRREAEKQLHSAEIAFLRAQINPHFLFNTLNFVYGNVAEKSTEAGNAILSLTKLLRYSVESTKTENSSLRREVEAVTEYLVLQKLRFGGRAYVDFEKSGLFMLFVIPPLVLLSLVENAFKYGIIDDEDNPIKINLNVDKDGLKFVCFNTKRLDFKDRETTSVGIKNIERRLELTYGSDYNLLVNEDDDTYEVILTILWKK
ncbi:histidine kinase [uncultured Arcticibacterium sp.]|uniref:sensor histidine kinase n=1 Tax=uncultured Arcticibacterium sp. TaxID=2173042 RepID=UPI0030F818E9